MAKPKQIKVCLTNQGDDTETPWAEDLGPAPGPPGARKVRLINVPFMHAKPTWGDAIIVTPVKDGFPTWDRAGVPWDRIGTRIADDGGRWAMIVDYVPHPDAHDPFNALAHACAESEVVCERAWEPRHGEPGRGYLAVKNELSDVALMQRLRAAGLPCELIQIHPQPQIPAKPASSAAPKASGTKTPPKQAAAKSAATVAKSAPKAAAKSAPTVAKFAPKAAATTVAKSAPKAAAKSVATVAKSAPKAAAKSVATVAKPAAKAAPKAAAKTKRR